MVQRWYSHTPIDCAFWGKKNSGYDYVTSTVLISTKRSEKKFQSLP